MEVIQANEKVSSEVIDEQSLLQMCKEMLKESRNMGQMTEKQQDEFRMKHSKFSLEFPNVFNMIVLEKIFYKEPFLKYIKFRKTQPLMYTSTEECVKDLCFYPLQVFKFMNKHYDQHVYDQFKAQLYDETKKAHMEQKEQFKTLTNLVDTKKKEIDSEFKQQLLQLSQMHVNKDI